MINTRIVKKGFYTIVATSGVGGACVGAYHGYKSTCKQDIISNIFYTVTSTVFCSGIGILYGYTCVISIPVTLMRINDITSICGIKPNKPPAW